MEYLIPIVITTTVAIITFFLGRKTKKSISDKEIALKAIDAVKFSNTIHPLVKHIYMLFVSEGGYKNFEHSGCYLLIHNLEIDIWSENNYYNRRFSSIPTSKLKKLNQTLKEVNSSLTTTDKKILDHIVKAVKVNNNEFISRVFI